MRPLRFLYQTKKKDILYIYNMVPHPTLQCCLLLPENAFSSLFLVWRDSRVSLKGLISRLYPSGNRLSSICLTSEIIRELVFPSWHLEKFPILSTKKQLGESPLPYALFTLANKTYFICSNLSGVTSYGLRIWAAKEGFICSCKRGLRTWIHQKGQKWSFIHFKYLCNDKNNQACHILGLLRKFKEIAFSLTRDCRGRMPQCMASGDDHSRRLVLSKQSPQIRRRLASDRSHFHGWKTASGWVKKRAMFRCWLTLVPRELWHFHLSSRS